MKHFKPYPIYVNHPGRWEAVRLRQRDAFVDKGDYKMMSWLDFTGKRLYEILEDKTPGPLERDYEDQVCKLLTKIASTRIGKLVFDSLNPKVKHWIVPLDYLDRTDCDCGAYEFPGAADQGGGVRVYFNPADWRPARWFSADDILFHELVHAYRDGRVGYDNLRWTPMREYKTAEEFLALHMQNVYLDNRGSPRFYRSYNSRQAVSKGVAYSSLIGDAEALMAFRYFVDVEPLAKAVAGWKVPADTFNPWRDYPVLERMYLDGSETRATRLPPF
jgi:hypothetical protein